MTEHVCPVGALTSSDFRFKARVWFLRSARTRLPGLRDRLQRVPRLRSAQQHAVPPPPAREHGGQQVLDVRRGHALVQARRRGPPAHARSSAARTRPSTRRSPPRRSSSRATTTTRRRSPSCSRRSTRTRTTSPSSTLAQDVPRRGRLLRLRPPARPGDDILMSEDKNPNTRGVMQIASTTPPRPFAELVEAHRRRHVRVRDRARLRARGRRGARRRRRSRKLKGVVTIAAHDGPLAKARAHRAARVLVGRGRRHLRQPPGHRAAERARARAARRRAPGLGARGRASARALGYAIDWKKLADVHRAMAPEAVAPRRQRRRAAAVARRGRRASRRRWHERASSSSSRSSRSSSSSCSC